MKPTLNRDPVYQQLHELLRGLVRQGEYSAGDKFPTEREVSERFAVSRATANKALSSLVSEGVLEFRKGVGHVCPRTRDGLRSALPHELHAQSGAGREKSRKRWS